MSHNHMSGKTTTQAIGPQSRNFPEPDFWPANNFRLARCRVEPQEVFDYGTDCLGIVHSDFGTGNTAAVSSGLKCISE